MRLKTARGFTVVEIMVTLLVMAVIFGITITFYRFQAKTAGISTKERSSRQGITLALATLQRDIVQAGYGMPFQPQGALCFGDSGAPGNYHWPPPVSTTHSNLNPEDPNYGQQVYGTLWVSYGQYILSSTPALYAIWPSLVYNMTPMSNMVGGTFSVPAADNQAGPWTLATAYANSVGAVIYWPYTGVGAYGSNAVILLPSGTCPPGQPSVPAGTVNTSGGTGTSMTQPPSGVVTQFTVTSSPPAGASFAPAVMYNFVRGNPDANPPTLGYITRNQMIANKDVQLPAPPGSAPISNCCLNTWLGDNSLYIWDFQVRALYLNQTIAPQAGNPQHQQQWAPTQADFSTFGPAPNGGSSLRYVEIKIVYVTLDSYSEDSIYTQLQDVKNKQINTVTKTLRVAPRTPILASY